jgi:hypothetical protein
MGGTIAAGHQNADKLRNLPKGAPEAAATILSGLGGGVADMAIRAGGILNPFNTMEESKAAGARAANALQYQPSEAAAPFLAPIADFMQKAQDTAEYDWQQIPGHKKIEEIWGQLNPRLREAITLGADIAL